MTRTLLPLVAIPLLLWSCGGAETPKEQPADTTALESSDNVDGEEGEINDLADFKFHTMIANLPSPLETFHLIDGVDIGMEGVTLTPPTESANMNTVSAKAYGYGMYMTDMGFMAYEHQNQQTLDYYQTCRDLAQSLGAGDVFDETISKNFEENTSSEEKFVKMMDEAFNAMDEYMVNNERFVNATEIFVGSWVESQIIATGILKDETLNETNRPLYEGIYEQKLHASNLMNVLSEIETELEPDVVDQVERIMMFYAGFGSVESITQNDLMDLEKMLRDLKKALIS